MSKTNFEPATRVASAAPARVFARYPLVDEPLAVFRFLGHTRSELHLKSGKEKKMSIPDDFLSALPFPQRAPELAEVDDIFGWMIGSWEMDAILHDMKGRTQETKGEMHASWVLEGRAIQDLFIFPRRADRRPGRPPKGDRYATTIRTYDPKLRTWSVTFINPAAQETNAQLAARLVGNNIEMEGKLSDGTQVRWRYQKITPTSFRYTAEKMQSDGKSWQLYLELFGKRSRSQTPA